MKRLIASDIHGSATYCKQLLKLYHREKCRKLILLGDIAYSGSYEAEYDFDPRAVIRLLDPLWESITCVEGNCDFGIGKLRPRFQTIPGHTIVNWEGKDVFLTHGHRSSLPPMGAAQLRFSGHTHVPAYHDYGDLVYANPGSVSLPRSGSNHSCIIYEPGLLRWLTLDGEEYRREVLPTP